MKNKVISYLAVFVIFLITSCANDPKKINLYGVQQNEASRTSPMAYLTAIIIIALMVVGAWKFYKNLTSKK